MAVISRYFTEFCDIEGLLGCYVTVVEVTVVDLYLTQANYDLC